MAARLYSGMVSITFRPLGCEEIIELANKAGLRAMEWTANIKGTAKHVPHGDIDRAREVRKMTEDAGLEICSYGSSFKAGCEFPVAGPFEKSLETALALQTSHIRIWAGDRASGAADESYREKVAEDSRRIADMAQKENVSVSYEYHVSSLTDTADSALRLLKDVNHANVKCYWQHVLNRGLDYNLAALKKISPWLRNVHAHNVIECEKEWQKYIETVRGVDGEHYVMLEHVQDDSREQFLEEAKCLKRLLGES